LTACQKPFEKKRHLELNILPLLFSSSVEELRGRCDFVVDLCIEKTEEEAEVFVIENKRAFLACFRWVYKFAHSCYQSNV
jgi:hypothetical protein